jgi:RNA polymerase sigma-70 factor (ECF subfamily)
VARVVQAKTAPGDPEAPDWNATLDALVAGDRLAFARFNRLVTGFLSQFRAYDFEDDWEDLRQEVLISVVQSARAGRLREAGALVGYVRAIARNKFVDRLKRRLRCSERETLPWEEEIDRTPAAGAPQPGSPQSAETRHDLRDALRALDARDRELIERVYLRGETYEEASLASGVALGTLKRRLREGLGSLRRRLEGAGDPP